MNVWFLGAMILVAFLAAAKAHGRQVRLERELAGIFEVVFGGRNPPAVEGIWRKDRWVFWSVWALSLLAFTVLGLLAAMPVWSFLFLSVTGAFLLSFFMAGMASAVR